MIDLLKNSCIYFQRIKSMDDREDGQNRGNVWPDDLCPNREDSIVSGSVRGRLKACLLFYVTDLHVNFSQAIRT